MNFSQVETVNEAISFLPDFVKKVLPKIEFDFKKINDLSINIPDSTSEPIDDPIKSYLNTIAYHSLLNKYEEISVAKGFQESKKNQEDIQVHRQLIKNFNIIEDLDLAFKMTFLNKCDEVEKPIVSEYYQRCFGRVLVENETIENE